MSIAQPTLSSTLTPPPICNHTSFDYTPTSATPGTTFDWTRPFIPGIANPAGAGSGDIHEVLNNSSNVLITVVYVFTLTAGSSTNVQNVSVEVEPTPVLNSPLSISVCSGAILNYMPSSLTPGVAYMWTRDFVAGISNPPTTGLGHISETLTNPGSTPVVVPYHYNLLIAGCTDTQTVFATVNPLPDAGTVTGVLGMCTGDTARYHSTISGGTWGTLHGFASVSTSGLATGLSAGADTVIYIVSNECGADTSRKAIQVTHCVTIVDRVNANFAIASVYPNPSSGSFTLKTSGNGRFTVSSLTGKIVAEYSVTKKVSTISLPADAAPGIYMGRFNGDDGTLAILKLIYNPR